MADTVALAWSDADFCLAIEPEHADVAHLARTIHERVCRTNFDAPGFCLVSLGERISSTSLRRSMIDLFHTLRSIHEERRGGSTLQLLSAARFDQQETTKPHRDGGPDECFLMLGYEPSIIRAELDMSDYSRCAHDHGLTPSEFLARHNPMFTSGADMLRDYTTRVRCFCNRNHQILVVNNSSAPYAGDTPRWQGVLHTARIVTPDASQRRIVNSMMVASAPIGASDVVSEPAQEEFVTTTAVRRRGYDKTDLDDDS
jgi:hypothetical protein